MGNINLPRVLLGGALATVVLIVGEFISGLLGGEEWAAYMAGLGIPDPGPLQMLAILVITIFYGVLLVWTYAAMRPRFGAGVTTAILAGLVVWAAGWLLPMATFIALGLFPTRLMIIAIVWGVVEVVGAAVAGAWVYREVEAPA